MGSMYEYAVSYHGDREYYTTSEVAEKFRVTPATVRRWIREGNLEAYKIYGRYLIHKDDVAEIEKMGRVLSALKRLTQE